MNRRKNLLISILIGILAASALGMTTDQIIQAVFNSSNNSLNVTAVGGGAPASSITSSSTTITNGNPTSVCFDDSGVLNCNDTGLTYDKATPLLDVGGSGAGYLSLDPGTVAALSTCNAGAAGTYTDVSDATSCTGTVTGGGSTNCAVYCNGSAWAYVAASGGGSISGLTAGVIPKAANSTSIADSILTDNTTDVDTGLTAGYASSLPNDTSTGTTLNKLVKLSSAGKALIVASTDTSGVLGVCAANCGTTGNASIVVQGPASCVFDNSVVTGDFVTNSTSVAGDCHDAGTSLTQGVPLLGTVTNASTTSGTRTVWFNGPDAANVTNVKGGGGKGGLPGGSQGAVQYNGGTGQFAGAGPTSGGIPYWSSSTAMGASAALTSNVLIKGGGAGGAPAVSSITDNGTTVSTSEPLSIGGLTYNGVLNVADIHSNSTSFTLAHRIELCSGGSGNYTATMPTSPTVGDVYTVINLDTTHTCILTRAGSQTLNGATTLTLAAYTAPTREDEHCIYIASNDWVCEGPAT